MKSSYVKAREFYYLFFLAFVLGVYVAFMRLEIVHFSTKRAELAQDIDRAKFENRALSLQITEISALQNLTEKADELNLEFVR